MKKLKVIDSIEHLLKGRRIFIKTGYVSGRYGTNMLSAIAMGCNIEAFLSGAAFVFCSNQKKVIKILIWEDDGYYLIERRITSKTFQWPMGDELEYIKSKIARDVIYLLLSNKKIL